MKIFVTGASGQVGHALVRLLADEGHWVVALTRTSTHARQLQSLGAEPVQGDLTHQIRFTEALRDCCAVIHLAGSSPDEGDEAAARRLDVDGTRNLLEVLRHDKIERFVYASSMAVLGDQAGDWVTEAIDPQPVTPHGIAKCEAERILLQANRLWRLPAVILRFGHVYGPGGLFGRLLDQLRSGDFAPPRKVLEAQWGLISTHDAARACRHFLRRGRPGEIYHCADDHPLTGAQALAAAANHVGLKGLPRAGFLSRWRQSRETTAALSLSARPRNDRLKREAAFAFEHPTITAGLASMIREEARAA